MTAAVTEAPKARRSRAKAKPATDPAFVLATSQLRALFSPVLPFADKGDSLPILAAVRVHSSGGYLYATATDRYRIGVQRVQVAPTPADEGEEKPLPDGIQFVLDRAAIQGLLSLHKPTRGHGDPELEFTVSADRVTVTGAGSFGFMDSSTTWRRLDDGFGIQYPSVGAIITTALQQAANTEPTPPIAVAFNPAYLADFRHVQGTQRYGDPMRLWITSVTKPALVRIGDDFIGALMPVRFASDGPTDGQLDESWAAAVAAAETKPEGSPS